MNHLVFPIACAVYDVNGKHVLKESTDMNALFDGVSASCEDLKHQGQLKIDLFPPKESDDGLNYSILSINGQKSDVSAAQQWLTQRHQKLHSTSIKAGAYHLFDRNLQMKSDVKNMLTEIMVETETEIIVRLGNPATISPCLVAVDSVGEIIMEIRGPYPSVHKAKVECLIYLDKLMGLSYDYLDIDSRLLATFCGRKKENIRKLMAETSSNIYVPSYWRQGSDSCRIHFTGDTSEIVEKVKDAAEKLVTEKSSIHAAQSVVKLNYQKLLTFLSLEKKSLCDIMYETASHIEFGEGSYMTVYGERDAQVSLAIKKLTDLCGTLVLSHIKFSIDLSTRLDRRRLIEITEKTRCSIRFTGVALDLIGDMDGIIKGLKFIKDMPDLQHTISDVSVFVEISSDYKEFITGKKNGKINKIVKSSAVNIFFNEDVANSLVIQLSSPLCYRTTDGLVQLKDELPAELEFYVADQHHKKIIGIGGKNIQTIMKNYGVYVKFIGADEFRHIGGPVDQEENVLARTPAKNTENLPELYRTIMEQIDQRNRDIVAIPLELTRKYHKLLYGNREQLKRRLEAAHNVSIRIPLSDEGDEKIIFKGLSDDIQETFMEIDNLIPEVYYYRIPRGKCMIDLLASADLKKFLTELRHDFGFKISTEEDESDVLVKFFGNRRSSKHISSVSDKLATWLTSKKVGIYSSFFDDSPELGSNRIDSGMETPPMDFVFCQSFSSFSCPDKSGPCRMKRMTGSAPNLQELTEKLDLAKAAESLPRNTTSIKTPSRTRHETESIMLRALGDSGPKSGRNSPFTRSLLSYGALSPSAPDYWESESSASSTLERQSALRVDTSMNSKNLQMNGFLDSVVDKVLPLHEDPQNKLDSLLDSIELGKFKKLFADNDVDFETFLTLNEDDLKELGLSLGARKRIGNAVSEIKKLREEKGTVRNFKPPKTPLTLNINPPESPWISSRQNWSKFTPYTPSTVGSPNPNSKSGVHQNFAPSPLSPSHHIGYVDFLPKTPLGSLNSSFSASSPIKQSFSQLDDSGASGVFGRPLGEKNSPMTRSSSFNGSLDGSRESLKAPGSNRPNPSPLSPRAKN